MLKCYVRWFEREQIYGLDDLLCYWLGVYIVVSREFYKKFDCDVSGNGDFKMQVFVCNFLNEEDFEDDVGENVIKFFEVMICIVDEIKNLVGL